MLLNVDLSDIVSRDTLPNYKSTRIEICEVIECQVSKYHSVNAIITLGVVIKGETPHFDFISSACANSISQLTVEKEFPIIFGVITTNTYKQALKRAQQKGLELADATILSINTYLQIAIK